MKLFRGYIKTNGKQAIEKFKGIPDENLRTYDDVKSLKDVAGIIASDIVLIDIDDSVQSEILAQIVEDKQLDCKIVQTTRGKHFFFRNNGKFNKCHTHTKLACGLTADIKAGVVPCYAVVKKDGEERFVEYDCDEYQEAPAWLQPVQSGVDFLGMTDGDGRDSALFSYILSLQSAGIDKENSITAIKLINQYLFKDKMSDSDINRITRDEAFQADIFFEKGHFLFDKFALYLKSEHHLKRIDGQLHMYRNGVYISGGIELEHEMIKHIPTLSRARRKEVLDYLDALIREETQACNPRYIAFKNGLVDVQTDEFIEFDPSIVNTNIIPFEYDKDAYDELTDQTLDRIACNNCNIRALLEEMAGYCLYRRNELGKAFILTGSGSNGKSTYLNMIKEMLGKSNYSVLDLSKLNDRFSTVMMYRKLAHIGDDISDGYIDDASEFKKIVTGESIKAEQNGAPAFSFEPFVKLIFSANNIPRIGRGRDSNAIIRRLVIIPFNASFKPTDEDYVPFISDKLKQDQAIQYLIKLALAGLKRVLINNDFTSDEQTVNELEEFKIANNPILGFFNENELSSIENQPTRDVYKRYVEHCLSNGLNHISKIEFSKQCKKYYNLVTANKRINNVVLSTFVRG